MNLRNRILFRLTTLGFVWILSACLMPTALQASQRVVVFAAASTKNALDQIADAYAQSGGNRPAISYAASSVLARQIQNGAPAAVFISADVRWMQYLGERELLAPDTQFDFARNRLALIAAPGFVVPDNLLPVRPSMPLADVLADGRLALANPSHVPAGRYAREALDKLGLWKAVSSRIAPANNVRFALTMVARGEAPLGIVYKSDLYAASAARSLAIVPAELHQPIRYPAALLKTASGSQPAMQLLKFLQSPTSQKILARFGFGESSER